MIHDEVHQQHCCKIHGCKYNEPGCPVINEIVVQAWPCEECEVDLDDDLIRIENEEILAEEENRRWSAPTPEGF